MLARMAKAGDLEPSAELHALLDRVEKYLDEGTQPVVKEAVAEIDRKLRYILKPELRTKRKTPASSTPAHAPDATNATVTSNKPPG